MTISFAEFFREASGFDVVFYAEPEQTTYVNGTREFRSQFRKPIGANLIGYVGISFYIHPYVDRDGNIQEEYRANIQLFPVPQKVG